MSVMKTSCSSCENCRDGKTAVAAMRCQVDCQPPAWVAGRAAQRADLRRNSEQAKQIPQAGAKLNKH